MRLILSAATTAPLAAGGWHPGVPVLTTPLQKRWLRRPGALTDSLRQLGALQLQVLREYRASAPPDEALGLRVAAGTPVWVREVLMSLDGTAVVAARSLARLAATHGLWQGMRRLRARPLADMLYHDHRIVRSPFAWARLQRPLAFYAALRRLDTPDGLLARRSVFWRGDQPLLVAECFLPDFWRLLAQQSGYQ